MHSWFRFLVARSKMSGEFSRCLGKGTPAPGPVPEGTIRVYSMRHSPFSQRTRLILKAKGINHEIVNINLISKPEWFLEKNPYGTVPVLETSKGQLIYESPIICEYLDEAYPEKKLYPTDPYEKAYQKMILEYTKLQPICVNFIRVFLSGEDAPAVKNEFQANLLKLEGMLANHKTKFFGGDSISMIDYLNWPWFDRIEAFQLFEYLDRTPRLKHWVDLMKLDPAVQATRTDPQILRGFLKLYFNNSLEACDYGL